MLKLSYISTPASEKISLAEESWQVFSPFLCRYQWASDDPSHSPRASEIAHAILNRGKPGACTFSRSEGYRYILPVLHHRHFEDAIAKHRKIYYVSYGSQALLYFDIDLHFAWQKLADGHEAKQKLDGLMRKFFGESVLFWAPSSRGFNGFLKVDLKGVSCALANEVFDRLEAALNRFLAFCNNLADFEIKGKIGYMQDGQYQWAQYGKLPIHHPDWDFAKLEAFKKTPSVSIHRLGVLCGMIEAQVPQDVLERHKEVKRSKGDSPFFEGDCFLVTPAIEKLLLEKHGDSWRWKFSLLCGGGDDTWLHERYYRPGKAPITDSELREELASVKDEPAQPLILDLRPMPTSAAPAPPRPTPQQKSPSKINLDLSDLMDEPDSFERQKEALFRLVRYLKRVPTPDEALAFIHDHLLFTGTWDEHLTRRRIRVRDILGFVALTFDPGKCANGHVNVGKYDKWAKKTFPNGLIGGRRRYIDEEGNVVEGSQGIQVGTKFIAVFMTLAEFALLIDKNQDDSVPHNRASELWDALYAKGLISVKFSARKWAVCREELVKHSIITITDRDYGPGKAMKWAPGLYFPFLGLWKSNKQPSLRGPVDLATFLPEEKREENKRT